MHTNVENDNLQDALRREAELRRALAQIHRVAGMRLPGRSRWPVAMGVITAIAESGQPVGTDEQLVASVREQVARYEAEEA